MLVPSPWQVKPRTQQAFVIISLLFSYEMVHIETWSRFDTLDKHLLGFLFEYPQPTFTSMILAENSRLQSVNKYQMIQVVHSTPPNKWTASITWYMYTERIQEFLDISR